METKTANNVVDRFKSARRVSAPLLAITTPDAPATVRAICAAYPDPDQCPPFLAWDCLAGLRGINKGGEAAAAETTGEGGAVHPVEALAAARNLPGADKDNPRGAVLFLHNAHLALEGDSRAQVIQGIANLRDAFKADRRTLVMLAPSITLPPEIGNDTLVIDQALPTDAEVTEILAEVHKAASVDLPGDLAPVLAATAGLPAFMVEQTAAMSLTKAGLNLAELWDRKRVAIEQTPGLQVWRGAESFDSIAGYQTIKDFLRKFLRGKRRPRLIVFVDEIEKSLAGLAGDTSGTTQDQLGVLLSDMENCKWDGLLLFGPAGTGKSNISKASGKEAEVPVVSMDLGAMKTGLVGGSEARMRSAMKTIKGMGQDRILFIATCNSLAVLPPELRRRFKCGTFFMDLPDETERAGIWELYRKAYNIGKKDKTPRAEGWTGAEIKQCCEYADNFGITLEDAAAFIVPVSKSAAEVVEGLRRNASGRFLSASKPGVYQWEGASKPAPTGRAIAEAGEVV